MPSDKKSQIDFQPSQLDLWGNKHEIQLEDFKVAREYARSLKLKSRMGWERIVISGKLKGTQIPAHPDRVYKNHGWKDWDDWLGIEDSTESKKQSSSLLFDNSDGQNLWSSNIKSKWMNFFDARQVVREYGFEYKKEWQMLIEGKFPGREPLHENIPENPDQVYKHVGWKNWKDWLIDPDNQTEYSGLHEARDFVRSNRLTDKRSWNTFLEQKAALISDYQITLPKRPHLEYSDSGWISWEDWLGAEIPYRDFKSTRKFIHSLKLKNRHEWKAFCQGHLTHKPVRTENIFAYPEIAYQDSGWKDWDDWLGLIKKIESNHETPDLHEVTIECRCKGRLENCPVCDGKGYYTRNI